MTEIKKENQKITWDIPLVLIATLFVLLRFGKLVVALLNPPTEKYYTYIFFIAYVIIALVWGFVAQPLKYPIWLMLVIGAVGFCAGLYFWSGVNSLVYIALYLPVMVIGYYLAVLADKVKLKA
jgi:hypothetical protein